MVNMNDINISVIGGSGVGKSSIVGLIYLY